MIELTRVESVLTNRKASFNIQARDLLIIFIGFFISRVSIMGELTPFGMAFLGSYILTKGSNIYLLFSVILGTFTLHGIGGMDYVLATMFIYWIFTKTREGKDYTLIKSAFISELAFLISKFLNMILTGGYSPYDVFMIIFEGILVFTMTYIFSFSMPIEDIRSKNISNEKLVCSFITIALALSGFNNMVFWGVSLKNIISIVLIIYLSYTQGVLIGVSSSIILGLVSYISHTEMPFIIAILAVGGLLAGIFRDLGKAGSILGFILGNGIISFYINKLGTSFIDYRELFFSAIIFLIISRYVKLDLNTIFAGNLEVEESYAKRKDEYVSKKLKNMSSLFNSLSQILKKSIEDKNIYSTSEAYKIIDDICNNTCKDCPNFKRCWEEDYYVTYAKIFNLTGIIENNGSNMDKLYREMGEFCEYGETLGNNIVKQYHAMEKDYLWNKRLMEQRNLLVEQFEGIGSIIENMSEDIYSNPIFNEELENLLIKELKNKRIDILDLTVAEIEKGELEVLVELDEKRDPIHMNRIKNVVSNSLGFPLTSDYSFCNTGYNRNYFKLYRVNRFSALTNVSAANNSEDKISGDSYTFGEIGNTTFLAISDGMGIGKKANIESSIAIELLEKLMETNINKDTSIRTINSVLRAKSDDEIFTTLDLGFIDLYTGKLQILKNGSPATFIKKKDRVEIINSRSLPIGILENVDFNIYEEELEDGDMVIMMSDGILDSNRDVRDGEKWMQDVIMGINSQNPKVISEEILNIAKSIEKDSSKDDMTVMVTKVWKSV